MATTTGFAPPDDGLIQIAYTVRDIEASTREFSARLGVGPWFVRGPFTPTQGRYRGEPTELRVTLAIGFSDRLMVELIQQLNDAPSVFKESIEARGYGFHHWAIGARDFGRSVARHIAAGYDIAFSARSRWGRVLYMDTTRALPGMIEIIEMTEALEKNYAGMYEASLGWDGREPVRMRG